MTRVDLRFRLTRPLNDILLERVATTHSVYGIHRVRLEPTLDQITVEYDGSRLTRDDVESMLHRAGIPVAMEGPGLL